MRKLTGKGPRPYNFVSRAKSRGRSQRAETAERPSTFWASPETQRIVLDKLGLAAILLMASFLANLYISRLGARDSRLLQAQTIRSNADLEKLKGTITRNNGLVAGAAQFHADVALAQKQEAGHLADAPLLERIKADQQHILDEEEAFLNLRNNLSTREDELRTRAYVDFVKAFSDLAHSQSVEDKQAASAAEAALIDAKTRIAIYGDRDVATAAADFFRRYSELAQPGGFATLAHLIILMRSHSNASGPSLSLNDVAALLYGRDLRKSD